jgi:hypothetical protein
MSDVVILHNYGNVGASEFKFYNIENRGDNGRAMNSKTKCYLFLLSVIGMHIGLLPSNFVSYVYRTRSNNQPYKIASFRRRLRSCGVRLAIVITITRAATFINKFRNI